MNDRDTSTGESQYDGYDGAALAARWQLPRVLAFAHVASTMDVAHAAAAGGAEAGTLVLADEQRSGRGRLGRPWASARGQGIWMTLVERVTDIEALDVLSLRIGLAAAAAIDAFAGGVVRLKWPNDLLVRGGKLAGVLIEARWRDGRPDWVAIGFGVNMQPPAEVPNAASLGGGARRVEVLDRLVPALRGASCASGPLSGDELSAYGARDIVTGLRVAEPAVGVVLGIGATGELRIRRDDGTESHHRYGSLIVEASGGRRSTGQSN